MDCCEAVSIVSAVLGFRAELASWLVGLAFGSAQASLGRTRASAWFMFLHIIATERFAMELLRRSHLSRESMDAQVTSMLRHDLERVVGMCRSRSGQTRWRHRARGTNAPCFLQSALLSARITNVETSMMRSVQQPYLVGSRAASIVSPA